MNMPGRVRPRRATQKRIPSGVSDPKGAGVSARVAIPARWRNGAPQLLSCFPTLRPKPNQVPKTEFPFEFPAQYKPEARTNGNDWIRSALVKNQPFGGMKATRVSENFRPSPLLGLGYEAPHKPNT